ncbi:MAG TPA: hypothetical protein VJ767_08190 [Nitrososphaeraceae archaeon]|nr:hypothetical protein [Nitrososphaeraceae archaeon]
MSKLDLDNEYRKDASIEESKLYVTSFEVDKLEAVGLQKIN